MVFGVENQLSDENRDYGINWYRLKRQSVVLLGRQLTQWLVDLKRRNIAVAVFHPTSHIRIDGHPFALDQELTVLDR